MKKLHVKGFIKAWLLPSVILKLVSRPQSTNENRLTEEDNRFVHESKKLENKHKGEHCFILGAGSSIKKQDLTKLQGENVISASNTFVHPVYPLFKPIYHVLSLILESHGHLNIPEK